MANGIAGIDEPRREGHTASGACARGRVLIAGRCLETVYRQRRALALALRGAGWEVHLCGDGGDPRYLAELTADGFTFHPLTLDQKTKSPRAALRLLLEYRSIVRSVAPDVVHVFNAKPTVIGLLGSALGRRTARIATIAGLGHIFMSKSRALRWCGRNAFRGALAFADAVIFYNGDDLRTFVDGGLLPEYKAHLIPGSGIELDRFTPAALPDGELEVLFIGRLLREKGVEDVIAAGRILRQRGVVARITIVGDVDHHNPSSLTREQIEGAVVEGAVRWRGPLHDIVRAIAASHVILLPSQREGIPLALVEGGAMGRALLATDVPGCRDVIATDRTGLLVPLGDVEALVAAIGRLAADRALVERLGRDAAKQIRARFESRAVGARVMALYDAVLDRARP